MCLGFFPNTMKNGIGECLLLVSIIFLIRCARTHSIRPSDSLAIHLACFSCAFLVSPTACFPSSNNSGTNTTQRWYRNVTIKIQDWEDGFIINESNIGSINKVVRELVEAGTGATSSAHGLTLVYFYSHL
jgi:hypothetical protein